MKKLVFTLLYRSGAVRLAAWRNRRQVMILCYHGVTERRERSANDPHGLHIRRERFGAQLDYLQRRYHVIPLAEYIAARREGRELPAYTVVLTFDDGYRNFLTAAAPCLSERSLPATVFLITDRVREDGVDGTVSDWNARDDESYLSWAEARHLRQQHGIEFGSHTCSHHKLTTIAPEEQERELRESQEKVVSLLDGQAASFAYPFGDYSRLLAERVRALGYVCALTTDEGGNDSRADLFTLRRTLIGDDDDEPSFAVRVSGLLGWLRKGTGQGAGHARMPDNIGAGVENGA